MNHFSLLYKYIEGRQRSEGCSSWGEYLIVLVIYFMPPVNPFIARSESLLSAAEGAEDSVAKFAFLVRARD